MPIVLRAREREKPEREKIPRADYLYIIYIAALGARTPESDRLDAIIAPGLLVYFSTLYVCAGPGNACNLRGSRGEEERKAIFASGASGLVNKKRRTCEMSGAGGASSYRRRPRFDSRRIYE